MLFGFAAADTRRLSESPFASDGTLAIKVLNNPKNPGLPIIVVLEGPGGSSYAVLPPTTLGDPATAPWMFEVGAKIEPVKHAGYDGVMHDFGHVRGYCRIGQNPGPNVADAGPLPNAVDAGGA